MGMRPYNSGPNENWRSGDAVFIRLTGDFIAVIDAADSERVLPLRWTIRRRRGCATYVYHHWNRAGEKGAIALHRFIMEPGPEKVVDHRDGDGLNNRRANLRVCDSGDNAKNRRKFVGGNRFKGVRPRRGHFEVTIRRGGVQSFVGIYHDEVTAALAYDIAAFAAHGEFAAPNFDPQRDWIFPSVNVAALDRLRSSLAEPKTFAPRGGRR